MKHWTLDDIAWDRFDVGKVDADLLRIVKAASLVEHNGGDYAVYLENVFKGDAEFQDAARAWAKEEVQHGQALQRWAELADPAWDFAAAFRRFNDGFKLPLSATTSVRGTRTGELIARCIVETGTSSYYAALAEASAEPVLKQICLKIAADELRHYKLFYTHMTRYQTAERLGFWGRLRTGLGRILESEDDELACAYWAANETSPTYARKPNSRAYARRAYAVYRPHHVERGIAMVMKAVGLSPQSRLHGWLSRFAGWVMRTRVASLAKTNA
ncbi:MAG TPA: ferritin-like domain-containing protein [Alphaproteobacteria bacterium]|nr:ferritin-like domain-containing protein [Alphaproteobacteria bacterium]